VGLFEGWIPKMLSNRLIVTRDGEWMLPFWRENTMLAKELWPDAQVGTPREQEKAPSD
jgi:hypothetical protein